KDKTAEIAQAKKLLADAGFPNGFELKILSRTNQITRDTATFMAAQMQNIGVNATVDVQQDTEFFTRQSATRYQMLVYTPIDTIPDPHWMMRYVQEGTTLVLTGLKDPKVDQLIEAQVREPNVQKRQALTREIEKYVLTESLHTIPVVGPITYVAVAPKVRAYTGGISDFVVNRLTDVWLAP
ncbi:MAG: ABC transporter substrate-binding protein, partial [Chloroflexota bacterium]